MRIFRRHSARHRRSESRPAELAAQTAYAGSGAASSARQHVHAGSEAPWEGGDNAAEADTLEVAPVPAEAPATERAGHQPAAAPTVDAAALRRDEHVRAMITVNALGAAVDAHGVQVPSAELAARIAAVLAVLDPAGGYGTDLPPLPGRLAPVAGLTPVEPVEPVADAGEAADEVANEAAPESPEAEVPAVADVPADAPVEEPAAGPGRPAAPRPRRTPPASVPNGEVFRPLPSRSPVTVGA